MAGTKGERSSQRLGVEGGRYAKAKPVGPGGRGGAGASTAPTPGTHTSLFPLRPLPEQLSFKRPKALGPAGSEATKPRSAPLPPGIPAPSRLPLPPPLPTCSQSPPTPSRRLPIHRSARFWRPESRLGDRGCTAGAEPKLKDQKPACPSQRKLGPNQPLHKKQGKVGHSSLWTLFPSLSQPPLWG
ncbi:uncharacterized protein isoform X2 [Macaca fascicularis]|uniref:uncharacterized protein isoform X2 n=1 Tax=Macaca fascicularis TaxID=9541 RepID=UPI003D15D8F3